MSNEFVLYRWDSTGGPRYYVVHSSTWVKEILNNQALRPTRTELARGPLMEMDRLLALTKEN